MPLKIPPLTPVPIQPTAAEPFSTFVKNTPPAITPLSGNELVALVQNGGSVHSTVGVVVPPFPAHRTILTANTNYYVATTGSDSNDGSLAHPWATTQHAANFTAANLDYAGFNVQVNIGTGTFVGFFVPGSTGGGNLSFIGAGSASTKLTPVSGAPNGTITAQVSALPTATFYLNAVTINIDGSAFGFFAIEPGNYFLGSLNFSDGDIIFQQTDNGAGTCIFLSGPLEALTTFGTFAVHTSGFLGGFLQCNDGAVFVEFNAAWTLTGTPALQNVSFVQMDNMAAYAPVGIWTGSATGKSFQLTNDTVINNQTGTNPFGTNFFPGNIAGTADPTSFYAGIEGPLPIDSQTGASYTLALSDIGNIVEMNNAGANTLTVPANATVGFEVGTKIWITQTGAGATTVSPAVGVTGHNFGAVGGQWKTVKLYQRAANEWVQTNA